MTPDFTVSDFAQNYASGFGWAVFPCHGFTDDGHCTCGKADCTSEGKHPRTPRGCLDATMNENEIAQWFQNAGDHSNIGIATGGVSQLVVVDVDTGKGANVNDLMIAGVDQTVFNTFKVKTGAGLHFYYKLPAGITIKNSAGKLANHIDIRGDGGYVIAPPSKHKSGSDYELLNPDPADIDLLDFPQPWLDKLLQPAAAPASNGNGSSSASPFVVTPGAPGVILPDSIDQGKRNVECTSIAGKLRDIGFDEADIFAALASINPRICKPPLDDKELRLIAHSVSRYTPKTFLDPVNDDPTGLRSTIDFMYVGELIDQVQPPYAPLAFHLERGDYAVVSAPKNVGKTTFLRNMAVHCALGKPFPSFLTSTTPSKVLYLDFESPRNRAQSDLRTVIESFSSDEQNLIRQNLMAVWKGVWKNERFSCDRHMPLIQQLVIQEKFDIVIIDNLSAAFSVDDENSAAVMNKKVVTPILDFTAKTDAVLVLAHHSGRNNTNNSYSGRGASVVEDLAATNFFIRDEGINKGLPMVVECRKRKDGQDYSETLNLDPETRRLTPSGIHVMPPAPPSLDEQIKTFLEGNTEMVPVLKVIERFRGPKKERSMILNAIKTLVDTGEVWRPVRGFVQFVQKADSGQTGQLGECDCPKAGVIGETCPACYRPFA